MDSIEKKDEEVKFSYKKEYCRDGIEAVVKYKKKKNETRVKNCSINWNNGCDVFNDVLLLEEVEEYTNFLNSLLSEIKKEVTENHDSSYYTDLIL